MSTPQFSQALPPTPEAVIIYGPQGCGKTRNADALMKHYGKTVVYDYEPGMQPIFKHPARALILTDIDLPGSIPFAMAMRAAGLQW